MRVVLISLSPTEGLNQESRPPLGLGYIASVLEKAGHEVKILDMNIKNYDYIKEIEEFKADIVGIQVITNTRFIAFRFAKEIKKKFPEILVVFGGPHVSFTAEDTLKNIKDVDIIVRGEGEFSFKEIVDGKNLNNIKGISFREDGKIIHNPEREPLDLDTLPFPAFHLFNLKKYELKYENRKAINIFTSRGCPNQCVFCSASEMWGRFTRFRNPKNVIREVEYLKDIGYMHFKLDDDTFTLNRKHAIKIIEGLKEISIKFDCRARVNCVDKELIELLKDAGCMEIEYGIESGSEKILKVINKNITLEEVNNAINWSLNSGMRVDAFFIAGHPEETYSEFLKSVRLAKELESKGVVTAWSFGMIIFPGTLLEAYAKKRNYLPKDFSWSKRFYNKKNLELLHSPEIPLLEQPQMSLQDLINLRKRFYLKKYLRSKMRNNKLLYPAVRFLERREIVRKLWRKLQ